MENLSTDGFGQIVIKDIVKRVEFYDFIFHKVNIFNINGLKRKK